ncbi:hypothetical protein Q0601_14360 [Paracoccus onubensis]|uniref:hypothetical protein n=1 Tax=Paracoccus onubensis TaxID=1675788 RepID=UPI00272FFA77|nr:hypothetical protein [Paracoccus onubensis]MDP0928366.1 hypothetical protein [Paracoccus onubensis]
MTSALRLVLVFCLALTGIGLGIARGTVQNGGQVVICTGDGVVIRHLPGAAGKSVAHICPDMALSFLDATAGADILITRDAGHYRPVPHPGGLSEHSRSVPLASARDPPSGLTTI